MDRSISVRSGLFEKLKIDRPVTVTVHGPWGQKTGPDRTSKHYLTIQRRLLKKLSGSVTL